MFNRIHTAVIGNNGKHNNVYSGITIKMRWILNR